MLAGIFWIDESSGSGMETVVSRAAASYRRRFHREPTLCLVPPGAMHGETSNLGPLSVRVHASLPPHYLWIGIDDASPRPQSHAGGSRRVTPARALWRRPG